MDEKEYYKKKIKEMLDKIDNEDFLNKIYHYIIPKYEKNKKDEAGD